MKKCIAIFLLCCSFAFVGCDRDNTQKQIDELTANIEQLQSDATINQATIEELQSQTASQKQQIEDLEEENANQKQQIEDLEKDNLLWQDHVLDGYGLRTSYKEHFNIMYGASLWHELFRMDYRRRERDVLVDDVTVAEVDLKLNYTHNGHYWNFPFYDGEKEVVGEMIQLIVFKNGAINSLGKIVEPELVHVIKEIHGEEFFSEKYGVEFVPITPNRGDGSSYEAFIKYTHEEVIKIPSIMFERTYHMEKVLYIGLSRYHIYADGTRQTSDIQVDGSRKCLYYTTFEYDAKGNEIDVECDEWVYRRIFLFEKV